MMQKHKPEATRRPTLRLPAIQTSLAQLTPLDVRLLQWLLHYPFQRADDLVIGVARWASRPTVYRHLATLHTRRLLEQFPFPALGSGKQLYTLSNLGLHVYAAHRGTSAQELACQWQIHERGFLRLLPRLPTLFCIQDVVNGLVSHTAEALTLQGRRPTLIQWNWQRDYVHRFTYREKEMRFTVDGAVRLSVRVPLPEHRSREQEYGLLLLHTPLNDRRLMHLRLERLLYWRESPERWSHYQYMPPVLILATSERQGECWHQCAEEVALRLKLEPLLGAVTCVPMPAFQGENPWLLPWRTLSTQTSCHLQDLLRPSPLPSIPGLLSLEEEEQTPVEVHTTSETTPAVSSTVATRVRTIIPMNLVQRAVPIQRTNANVSEHETMALLGLRLTARLWKLLFLLLDHPLLSIAELASLLHLEVRSVQCFVYELHTLGCLQSVRTEMGRRWWLSGRGLRLVAVATHCHIRNLVVFPETEDEPSDIVQRGQAWLLRHIQHTAGIYGFFAALSQAAEQECLKGQGEHALRWWETGATCERRYSVQNRWHNLRPDALAEYQWEEQRIRFWLEWDRGTMNVRDLAIKFTSYAQYMSSREWARERSVLPMLLCVAPDMAQEKRILRVAQAMLANTPGLLVRSTVVPYLATEGPLAAIWLHGRPPSLEPVGHVHPMRHPLFDTRGLT